MALTGKCISTGHGYLHTQLATFQPKLRTYLHGRVLDCHKIHRILSTIISCLEPIDFIHNKSLLTEESILNLLLKIRLLKKLSYYIEEDCYPFAKYSLSYIDEFRSYQILQ